MKRLAVIAALLAVAACKPKDTGSTTTDSTSTTTTTPAMTPAPADTGMKKDTSMKMNMGAMNVTSMSMVSATCK